MKDSLIDPGYIRDYPPGVRENGAQYNHAALWAVQAFAELKDSDTAMRILNGINPIKRSEDKNKAEIYRVEPYVVASDIYSKPAESGRGGWTWYTGSAGVMYKTILENILGFKIRADKMEINPCIPKEWNGFSMKYTYKDTIYDINIVNNIDINDNSQKIKIDGIDIPGHTIILVDDKKTHKVEVKL
jgi:cyclic beta-1,2-glucan synthetase